MFTDYTVQETLYTIHGTHNQFIQEKKTLQMGPTVLFKYFKKIISKFFSVFSEISYIQMDLMLIPIRNFE